MTQESTTAHWCPNEAFKPISQPKSPIECGEPKDMRGRSLVAANENLQAWPFNSFPKDWYGG
jgi:hypothetical protein